MKIVICTETQQRSQIGIHLANPDLWYLNDALGTAERDLFPAIFCHYRTQGTNCYLTPQDVLERLVELAAGGFEIEFTHPAGNDVSIDNVRRMRAVAKGK